MKQTVHRVSLMVAPMFYLSALLLFAASSQAHASVADEYTYDETTPIRLYSEYRDSTTLYRSGTDACQALAGSYNAGGGETIATGGLSFGSNAGDYGCWSTVTWTENGVVIEQSRIFEQNWASPAGYCRSDTTYSGGLCKKARPAEKVGCDKTADPIFPGRGCQMQTEIDYQSAAKSAPLSFIRQYSSWHFQNYPNTLGQNWFISLFGRYLAFDPSPTFIAATRALGNSLGWDLTGGVWVARTPTADTLQNYADGHGSAYRYYDSERQAYEYYDAGGVLQRIQQLGGDTYTLTYSTGSTPSSVAPAPGLLITIATSNGASLSLTYSSAGLLSTMTDPAGRTYTYAYSDGTTIPAGYLTSVTYPDSSSRQYLYEVSNGAMINYPFDAASLTTAQLSGFTAVSVSVGDSDVGYTEQFASATLQNAAYAMTGIIDENGSRYSTWQYDSQGRPTYSAEADGAGATTVTYTNDSTVEVTNPLGNVSTYNYTVQGSDRKVLTSITGGPCPDCNPNSAFTANSDGTIASVTDWNGNVTTYSYDSGGRGLEVARTEGYGTTQARTVTTSWHASLDLPISSSTYANDTGTGTALQTTSYSYDSSGNMLTKTVTDPTVTPNLSRTWTYTYDGAGRVLTAQGPRTDISSDVTTYTYYTCTTGYQCGEVQTATDAAGHTTTYDTYNADGQPLTITDPNAIVTTLSYDARQRLLSRTVAGEVTTFSYYPNGLLKQVTLPDSGHLLYTYDAAHRLVGISDAAGNSIQYTLDAMGNHTSTSTYDPSNVLSTTQSQVFNSVNQLSQTIGSAGTTAVTTTYGHDNNGNQTASNAPLSRDTANVYDALNRLTQITDPNSGVTQLGYDAIDNLASVRDPASLTTHYTHDAFGDLVQQVSPATDVTSNSYDSAGNLLLSQDARGITSQYTYDPLNRLTQVAYGDQTISFTYDAGTHGKGHLTGASDAHHSMSWGYDALGRVVTKSQTVAGITEPTAYAYSDGDMTGLTTPSGQSIVYSYGNHRITAIAINGTTLLSGVSYEPFGAARGWSWGNGSHEVRSHDADGNPSLLTGAESSSYAVDSAFRIVNITNTANAGLSWNYGYDSLDRLTSASTGTSTLGWTYDGDGNRASQSGGGGPASTASTFSYNNRGRMTSATTTLGHMTAIYNALGQRIAKSSPTVAVLFSYDEAGHLLGEYDGSGNLIEETIWLEDLPVATLRPDGSGGVNVLYIHADHLNTPKAITNPTTNAIVWRWDQDPFGTAAPNQNPTGAGTFAYNLRFPGQYYDQETGLNYNYFRDYDPDVGRYVESDPIGLYGGSLSTYAYANGDPVTTIDQLGLRPPQSSTAPSLIPPSPLDFLVPNSPTNNAWVQSTLHQVDDALTKAGRAVHNVCLTLMNSKLPLDVGGEQWGRRNGVGADEGRRRAHQIKQKAKGRPTDKFTVDPDTGDVYDPNGDEVGNIGDVRS